VGKPSGRGSRLRRFVLEGLVIVSSILLAFGIDAWWDDRQEGQAFSRTLEGLGSAFSENVAGIEDHLETISLLTDQVNVFLDGAPAELTQLPEDSAHAVLVAVLRQGTASLNNEYLTELVDAADLSGYREIEATVALWRRQAFLLRERRAELVELEQRLSLEAGQHAELSRHVRRLEPPHGDAQGLAVLRRNPEAVALATLKAGNWVVYASYFSQMRDVSESLIDLLRDARTTR
jgi:hypothetical protein